MKSIIECIEDRDPSYGEHLTAHIAKGAGVGMDVLLAAISRVYVDGMVGPFTDQEWRDMTPGIALPMARAQEILGKALEVPIDDYVDTAICAEENEEGVVVEWEEEIYRVDGDDIREAFFWKLVKVYGGLPAFA